MKKYLYKRVMIIDDTKLDRFISENVIKRDSFAEEISDFNSAAAALAHLNTIVNTPELLPEIIFLDINMPIMNGFEFVERYMKFPEFVKQRCNIIMVSSTNSQDDFDKINTYPSIRLFFRKPLSERILYDIRKNLGKEVAVRS